MASLKTTYMGIELKNPLIVGASNLVTDLKFLKEVEDAGAAAVVYKSLFEEQIQLENLQLAEQLKEYDERNAEMTNLFPEVEHSGPKDFLLQLKKTREALSIPLFASLNAVWEETWVEYAVAMEETGVAGLELNFYANPQQADREEADIINEQIRILKAVRSAIKIPIAVKLSPFYTNPLRLIGQMDEAGAGAVVLFNKLFQPDIDIHSEKHFFPYLLSHPEDSRLAIRFAGLLFNTIKADVCANSGIYEGEDMVKLILAGANSVQVVSTIYKNKPIHIQKMLTTLEQWMDNKGYKELKDFRGKLSRSRLGDPFTYKRAQYVDILMKSDQIFKKYPLR
jgi:dihydroorotate dehydrogenase (fumarate)